MNCSFTYKHFEEVIKLAKRLGFSFCSMHGFIIEKPKGKFIVMRHDVDLSLKHALAMAKFEKRFGIKSTYFVRANGIFNPFKGKNLEMMRQISKLGHEIGFHYEFDAKSLEYFKKDFLTQKKKFEALLNKKIFGAALHKTKKINSAGARRLNIAEPFLSELGLEYDAYSDIFTKKMKYISDSSYRWREGCMCNHIKKESRLCILTHPIWWSNTTTSLVSIIEELFE